MAGSGAQRANAPPIDVRFVRRHDRDLEAEKQIGPPAGEARTAQVRRANSGLSGFFRSPRGLALARRDGRALLRISEA
jgi:hypothetical protein